jgi:hypothetical protein
VLFVSLGDRIVENDVSFDLSRVAGIDCFRAGWAKSASCSSAFVDAANLIANQFGLSATASTSPSFVEPSDHSQHLRVGEIAKSNSSLTIVLTSRQPSGLR